MTETSEHRPPQHHQCDCCDGLLDAQRANQHLHRETRDLRHQVVVARRRARRHKWIIHGSLLAAIIISLILEGAKLADLLFFALAVVTEVS